MSVHYSYAKTPDVVGKKRQRLFHQEDIKIDDVSLLDILEPTELEPDDTEAEDLLQDDNEPINESLNYNPAIGDISSPITADEHDITNMKHDESDDILYNNNRNSIGLLSNKTISDVDNATIPDDIISNETALTASERNKLAEDSFGLPRLRQYPLIDKQHVLQAVRMFHHCKNKNDKKILANNIFRAINKFKMHITISKDNPLYKYTPKVLQESSVLDIFSIDAPESVQDMINLNSDFCNNLFYNTDFVKSIKMLKAFTFLDYFYPCIKSPSSFHNRIRTVLGGIAVNPDAYRLLGLKSIDADDIGKPINDYNGNSIEEFKVFLTTYYDKNENWFTSNISNDIAHTIYCLCLYSVLSEILLNKNFTEDALSDKQISILLDWSHLVEYHYDLLNTYNENDKEYVKEAQYLYDLFWDITCNPHSRHDINSNIASTLRSMACSDMFQSQLNENIDIGTILKKNYTEYFKDKLKFTDDIYLLPDELQYPIIDQGSVKLAMDSINRIRKEDAINLSTYVKNLNRKYVELGCKFSISVDHPYAKYANQEIIDNMTHFLLEGDTVVDDGGGSAADTTGDVEPWYKKLDYFGAVGGTDNGLSTSKELGPNTKSMQEPNYTAGESIL